MILGIGNDLTDIRRIEELCLEFGKKFEERIFTAEEIAAAEKRGKSGLKGKASSLAKRFAAKEACAKALGTGIGAHLSWHEIAIANHANGAPYIMLSGHAAEYLRKMTPFGMTAHIHLSLSDEYPMAQAFVVISVHPG